jgi:hypothetical protein
VYRRYSLVTLGVLASCVAACNHREPPAVATAAPPGGPSCDGFDGRIHGASACVRYDRGAQTVARIRDRVMPGEATGAVDCGKDLQLRTLRVTLSCDEDRPASRPSDKRAVVAVAIADPARPAATGRRVILDEHEGFWDFIHVWVAETDRHLDFTIDYGVLD